MAATLGSPNILYRFYSATGQLLYVGITVNPPARFKDHQGSKSWWDQVSGITVESYDSKDDLTRAERRAIQVERPLHNIVHNGARKQLHAPTVVTTNYTPILTYRCAACGGEVAKGSGYLHVSYAEIHEAQESSRQLEEKMRAENRQYFIGSELLDIKSARWRVHHRDCDSDPDGNDYWVDVGRIATHEKLLSWTAHLLGKSWLNDTNWSQFLYSTLSKEAKTL